MNSPHMNRPVVVIDDNTTHLDFVVTLLRRAGFTAEGFTRAKRALEYVRGSETAVIVTDLFMPDMDGIEVLRCVQQEIPHIGVIGISGSQWGAGNYYLSVLRSLGAAEIIAKPLDPAALIAAVERLFPQSASSSCANVA